MRGRKSALGFWGLLSLLGWLSFLGPLIFVQQAAAFIVINEILADPPAVPELPTLGYLAWGGLGLLRFRRRRSTGG